MKNSYAFIFLLFLTATAFTACKKDSATLDTRLEGRWDLKSFVHEEYIDGVLQQPDPNESHTSTNDYMIFKDKEVSLFSISDELVSLGTYLLIGDRLSITMNGSTYIFPINFTGNDEFKVISRYDISIKDKEYGVNTSTYVRHK